MRPRPNADPLLRARGGPRKARVHLNEPRPPVFPISTTGEGHECLQRRPPRLEHRRAEREHILSPFQVVARATRDAVHQAHDDVGPVEICVIDVVRCTERLQKLTPEILDCPRAVAGHQGQCLWAPGCPKLMQALTQKRDRLFTRHLSPLTRATGARSHERRSEALWVV